MKGIGQSRRGQIYFSSPRTRLGLLAQVSDPAQMLEHGFVRRRGKPRRSRVPGRGPLDSVEFAKQLCNDVRQFVGKVDTFERIVREVVLMGVYQEGKLTNQHSCAKIWAARPITPGSPIVVSR